MAHAIILAGGMATRLGEISKSTPKCLVPCAGRPFIDYSLAWMAESGVTRATFVLGHLSDAVVSHLDNLHIKGLKIDYVLEGEQRRGTGGAVALGVEKAGLEDDFLVAYGDSFMPINFANAFELGRALNAKCLMTVFHNRNQYDTSNVRFQPPMVARYSKDKAIQASGGFEFIDYGVTYWKTEAFRQLAPVKTTWDLAELLEPLSTQNLLHGLEVDKRFYEIGSPSGYAEFCALTEGKIDPATFNMITSSLKRIEE